MAGKRFTEANEGNQAGRSVADTWEWAFSSSFPSLASVHPTMQEGEDSEPRPGLWILLPCKAPIPGYYSKTKVF
jgi:hypothetical protein